MTGPGQPNSQPTDSEDASERIVVLEAAVASLQGQVDRMRRDRASVLREAEESRRQLAAVYGSTTWRVGRLLLAGPTRFNRALRSNALLRRLVLARRAAPPPVPTRPGASAAAVDTSEVAELRAAYERALGRQEFSRSATGIVFAVSTTHLDGGRGDLYTAVGLGRRLEERGFEVVYRPPARWYDLPAGTDVVVSLLAERSAMLNPLRLPAGVTSIAWVRNLTERWAASGTLAFYDGVLCSSQASLRALRRVYRGPIALLRLAVDEQLFAPGLAERRDLVVSTVNAWGSERALHRTLRALHVDFPLTLLGQQLGVHPELGRFAGGPISFFALPTVYGQASLVLDDLQEANVAHGNVNSRVFESLACGALPVANAAAGLREVGLADVPVAVDAQALATEVARFRSDPGHRDRLAARLQDTVLREHTYGVRAAALQEFLETGLPAATEAGTDEVVLGFFPDYRASNPYQDMLYSRAGRHGMVPVAVDEPRKVAESPALRGRPFVFHVHWTAPILGPARSRRVAEERCRRFIDDLVAVKARGAKVVWTVHNALPHECRFPDVEIRLRAALVEHCDIVHVMCPETATLLPEGLRLPEDKVRVVPHGSYVDVYPNIVSPAQARLELGLEPEHMVLLFLGGVRPYKALDDLLDAFSVVSRERPDYRLLVAGPTRPFHELTDVERRCEEHPAVLPLFARVPDVDLQLYLGACDVVVLPHRSVLNSGGLQLAWSFGRPVVARRGGCLTGQVSLPAGVTFEGQDGFTEALHAAGQLRTDDARRASFQRALAYPYTKMSEEFLTLVSTLATEGSSCRPLR